MDLRPWDLWTHDGQPQPGTDEVIQVLKAVLAKEPDHPLALHLYIHAQEVSPHPGEADAAADRLRNLQPGLAHLVHMPSHVDVRRGRWKEAELANEKAIAADEAYRKVRPSQGFYRIYMLHNRHMLAFVAVMRGESGRAIRVIDEMIATVPPDWARQNATLADRVLAMPLELRMRFGRWDEVLAAPEPDVIFPTARAFRHALRGAASPPRGRSPRPAPSSKRSSRRRNGSQTRLRSSSTKRSTSSAWPSTSLPARSSIARGSRTRRLPPSARPCAARMRYATPSHRTGAFPCVTHSAPR